MIDIYVARDANSEADTNNIGGKKKKDLSSPRGIVFLIFAEQASRRRKLAVEMLDGKNHGSLREREKSAVVSLIYLRSSTHIFIACQSRFLIIVERLKALFT